MKEKAGYYEKVHLWGKLTLCIAIILFLGINFYLSFVMGLHPGWDAIITGFLSVAAVVGHTWVNVSDIFVFLLLMGPAGTYMAQLTGNVKNMRMPSAIAACSMLDEKASKLKRDILASYGVGVSVIVNTLALTLLLVAGKFILDALPESILQGISYIVPALFGTILAQFFLRNICASGISLLAVLICLVLHFIPDMLRPLTAILLAIIFNITVEKYKQKRKTNHQK